ncbi:MAG: hypothetical protein FWH55_12910 [Oscillospiraceae bacterium]|nr:hypothetical protein [Oscillospiraceae bacterium]
MEKIFLFDDAFQTRTAIATKLTRRGHDVSSFHSVFVAAEALKNNQYDWYIISLSANVTGLSPACAQRSCAGLYTGWILLTDYILQQRHGKDKLCKAVFLTSNNNEEQLEKIFLEKAPKKEQRWFYELRERRVFFDKLSGIEAMIHHLEE